MSKVEYKIRVGVLQWLYEQGKKISLIDNNKRATTLRAIQAEKIVEKVMLHCGSIVKLFSVDGTDYSEVDIALIASAARNIIDSAKIYFYVAERGISDEEIKLRYYLQLLNYDKNIKNIFRKFDFSLTSFRMKFFNFEGTRDDIKNSRIYKKADGDDKSLLLSGTQFYNRKNLKILNLDIESGLYNVLSNSIHSYYIGLSNNSFKNSFLFASCIDSIMLSILAVEVAIIYTANIINDYILLRRKVGKKLSDGEKSMVKQLMKPDYLYGYINYQKEVFDRDPFFELLEL